jgi:DNA-binding NarL/FixJ family response regulator
MRRRHGVRLHPIRQDSIGAHRVRVFVVADDRAIGHALPARHTRMRRHDVVVDTSLGREHAPSGSPVGSTPNLLSAREREVLGMMVRGLRNKEIADLLFISDRTVKFHAQAIFRKLDVANRTEAVSVAFRRGIVALDSSVPSASDVA